MSKSFLNILILSLSVFLNSCVVFELDKSELVLTLSGNNRDELNKVLVHFKNEPEKLKAVHFLIENMPEHFAQDLQIIESLNPIYDKHVSISEKYNWIRSTEWKEELDSCMKTNLSSIYANKFRKDIHIIKSDWLINEIDRSFKAWKENAYTKDAKIEDFCRYILPYRFSECVYPDDSRDVFYKRHTHFFDNSEKDFKDVCDSLLFKYVFLMHNDFAAANLPIYSASALEQIKRSSCEDRAWYNCLLMSSLGMAVSIDFVPYWGNRSGSHTWNSMIIKGETYPFEPFWDVERWKYKTIYNNETYDLLRGKFRLPKVYRRTYELHLEGPLSDESVKKEDIPSLFRYPFVKDVSTEYFKTTDVKVNITEPIPDDTHYCYLCVYNAGEWKPVQWAKINWIHSAKFKGMGRDIVYAPMFYKNGVLIRAGSAFLLDQNGNYQIMKPEKEKTSIIIRSFTSHLTAKEISACRKLLRGSSLVGYHKDILEAGDTIYKFTNHIDTYCNDTTIVGTQKYRYIRLIPATDSIGLCDISFFEKGKRISDIKVSVNASSSVEEEKPDMLTDQYSGTGFKCVFKNDNDREAGILFDFGKPCKINGLSYGLYTPSYVTEEAEYTIYYWDNQWIPAGVLKGGRSFITFCNIPKGTLYRVRTPRYNERIFVYNEGAICWL